MPLAEFELNVNRSRCWMVTISTTVGSVHISMMLRSACVSSHCHPFSTFSWFASFLRSTYVFFAVLCTAQHRTIFVSVTMSLQFYVNND